MDPNATVDRICNPNLSKADRQDAIWDLYEWIQRGGALPGEDAINKLDALSLPGPVGISLDSLKYALGMI